MVKRRGASTLGCLFWLLIAVTVSYFAFNVGEVYVRYYRFLDAMRQEARFASSRSDADIIRRLDAVADALDIPNEASPVRLRRTANRLTISAEYVETVELPMRTRDFRFSPRVSVAR